VDARLRQVVDPHRDPCRVQQTVARRSEPRCVRIDRHLTTERDDARLRGVEWRRAQQASLFEFDRERGQLLSVLVDNIGHCDDIVLGANVSKSNVGRGRQRRQECEDALVRLGDYEARTRGIILPPGYIDAVPPTNQRHPRADLRYEGAEGPHIRNAEANARRIGGHHTGIGARSDRMNGHA